MAARWLRSRSDSRALILGYHTIADDGFDPYGIGVTTEAFAGQIRAIRKTAHPVSLSTLVHDLRADTVRPGSVAVTFDDAYTDVLETALPLLQEFEVPATVFVITGMQGSELWWDRLARAVPMNHDYMQVLTESYQQLLLSSPSSRERTLAKLEQNGVSVAAPAAVRRTLSVEELQQLGRSTLIDIGSHTVTHMPAACLSTAELEEEFVQSKASLEETLSRKIRWLSYPNGSWTAEAKSFALRAGYDAAFSSVNDVVSSGSDLMCLPRFWSRSREAAAFEDWLRWWL